MRLLMEGARQGQMRGPPPRRDRPRDDDDDEDEDEDDEEDSQSSDDEESSDDDKDLESLRDDVSSLHKELAELSALVRRLAEDRE
jgi:hypothetical protein